ncbi:MAG: adenosine kinase, partial [Bacteroidales bacterium]|nr:adenosine kinase [Bacteroidales bacterium]
LIRACDILIASESFARYFSSGDNFKAAEKIFLLGPEIVVIPLGNKGCLCKSMDKSFIQPAFKIKVVDTTGAGDLYAAGFLYGYSNGFSLDKCGLFGSILAGKVIEDVGARMAEGKWQEAKELIGSVSAD